MNNGNGWIKKTLITFLVTLLLGYIGYIGKVQFALAEYIIENDKASRERDTTITRKNHKTELEVRDRLTDIIIQLTKIQTKLGIDN